MPNPNSELSPISKQPIAPLVESPIVQRSSGFKPLSYIQRHSALAGSVFALLFLAGALFLRGYLHPTYSAETVVYVSPVFPTDLADNHEHDRQYDAFMEQQIYAVTRAENLQAAIRKYPSFWSFPNEKEQDAIGRLQKALKVEEMGHSYQMSITLQTTKRDGLADFLNEITSAYLVGAHNDEFYGHVDRIDTLTKERQKLSGALDIDLRKQDQLLSQLGIAQLDPSSATNPFDSELQRLREQLSQAHEQRAEADAQMIAVEAKAAGSASALDQAAGAQAVTDPSVVTVAAQLNTRRAALLLQMNGLTPQNPLYKPSQTELAYIDSQLKVLTNEATTRVAGQLKQKYSTERTRAERLESQLSGDLNKTQMLASRAAPKIQQAQIIGDEIKRLQANYAVIDGRISVLQLEGNSPGSEHVVSWAAAPTSAVAKHGLLYLLILSCMSLVGAFVAAFLADLLGSDIYTAHDIERLIGFAPIGMLLDEHDFSKTLRSEYLLRLAAGIDQAYRRSAARSFVFTSAGVGDTRQLVRELGTELAKSGLKTLVITVESAFEPRAGVEETAVKANGNGGSIDLQRKDNVVALSSDARNPSDLLEVVTKSPQGLPAFLRKASSAYNTILIGADPLLLSAYTEQLVRVADGTVLVAESGTITKKQLARSARLLERLKISGVAVVLSNIRMRRADEEITANLADYGKRVPVRL